MEASGPLTSVNRAPMRAWLITSMLVIGAMVSFPSFFRWIELRGGAVPYDPVLGAIPAIDLSTPLNTVLYLSIAIVVFALVRNPNLFLRCLQAYFILVMLRMICMTLVPLEPPAGLIPLQDPIGQLFYPSAEPFEKDLFFSGHTATAYLLFLIAPSRSLRIMMLFVTMFVAFAVLVQHIHWTVDVIAAPLAAWFAWSLSGMTIRWSNPLEGGSDQPSFFR